MMAIRWPERAGERREAGFTLVELLVAMTLFMVLSAIVLTCVLAMSKGLDSVRSTSDVSGEARVAIERMARELRQAKEIQDPTTTSMTVRVDFDGNGIIGDSLDDPEIIAYAWDADDKSISMTAEDKSGGKIRQSILAGQVKELAFHYRSSNSVKYSPDDEVAIAADVDRVQISLTVERDDGKKEHFNTQVTMRNRSQS